MPRAAGRLNRKTQLTRASVGAPQTENERNEHQKGGANAAAKRSSVHRHIPRKRKNAEESVPVSEAIEESAQAPVALRGPVGGIGPKEPVERGEDRVSGRELGANVPSQRGQEGDRR